MKKLKLSAVCNTLIIILTILATIIMLSGFKFMGDDLPLTINGLEAFKFFTVESNIMMAIIAAVFLVYEILIAKGVKKDIPNKIYILKLVFTTAVVLTMLTTAIFLAPTTPYGYTSMFKNCNLFYHLIIPLLSLITFVFFEKTDKIRFRYTFAGVAPMLIYSIFYVWNVVVHLENGMTNESYDWYGFFAGGIPNIICVVPIMLGSTYLISYLLWYFNKRKNVI